MMADLLDSFPSPVRLRQICIALAVLDVAMSPDDEPDDRIFRFDPRDPSGVAMASMDNGQGDRYYIAFGETAVFGWGFAHEYPMNPFMRTTVEVWPGLLDGMPASLEPLTQEERFRLANTFMATAAFWSEDRRTWCAGTATAPPADPSADGAAELFELLLDGGPQAYVRFAQEYFELDPSEAAVSAVYRSEPLVPAILAELNADADYEDVRAQLDAMGLSGA